MQTLILTEHIQLTGIRLGITTITLAHGVTEVTTTLGATDTTLGTMAATTVDIIAGITEVTTTRGITDMTLGTMVVGMEDSMTHGTTVITDTMVMRASMILTTITCIHTIADGMVDGAHTMEEFTTDHHTVEGMESSPAETAKMYIEAHVMRLFPTGLLLV